MSKNGNYPHIVIRPIEILSKPLTSQNFMNSPKSNPVKMFKQDQSLGQAIYSNQKFQETPLKPTFETRSGNQKLPQHPEINTRDEKPGRKMRWYQSESAMDCEDEEHISNQQSSHTQYKQMHQKLNTLENKLTTMRQKFLKKKEQRKKNNTILQQNNRTSMDSKSKQKDKDKDKKQQKSKNKKNEKNTEVLKQLVTQVNCKKSMKVLNQDPYSTNNTIYYVSQVIRTYKDMNSEAREHIINSHRQLKTLQNIKGYNQKQVNMHQVKLNKKQIHQGKKTVIFDLDQTLIHCNENTNAPCDVKLKIKFANNQMVEAAINVRPYAKQILQNLSKKFEIIVFTASHPAYANQVLNYLDPQNEYISHRLFRESCYQTPEGVYIKDLRIMNRQLSQTVLIDNAAYSYSLQLENGIPILPYYEGKIDFELKALQRYLEGLISCRDVRDINRNVFKLNKYCQFEQPHDLVSVLYGDILE